MKIGEKVIYKPVVGKEKNAIILKRSEDYPNGFMKEFNLKSSFDYLIEIEDKVEDKQIFCRKNQLRKNE